MDTLRKCFSINDLRGGPAQVLDNQRLTAEASIARRARFVNNFRKNLSENSLRFFLCFSRLLLYFEHEKRNKRDDERGTDPRHRAHLCRARIQQNLSPAHLGRRSREDCGRIRLDKALKFSILYHMKDNINKSKGPPFSTSRSEEKKNKHRTQKARRQAGRKLVRESSE